MHTMLSSAATTCAIVVVGILLLLFLKGEEQNSEIDPLSGVTYRLHSIQKLGEMTEKVDGKAITHRMFRLLLEEEVKGYKKNPEYFNFFLDQDENSLPRPGDRVILQTSKKGVKLLTVGPSGSTVFLLY